jgi:flagellin FlaA/flagellin FlaB
MHSRQSVAITIVIAALVAVAGCTSGMLEDPSGTNEDPSGTDSSTNKTLDDLSLPDGTSEEAVENGSALAAAHTSALSETGYTVEVTALLSSGQESENSTYVVRRDTETGELYQRVVQESGGDEQRRFAYANATATYEKRGTDSPSYDVNRDTTSDDQATNNVVNAVETLVPAGNWTDPSVVSVDGQTLVEYDFAGIPSDAEFFQPETVTNASGSLLVDQQGVVHRVTLNVTQERDGTVSETDIDYRVAELGDVSVEKPDWVSTAAAQQDESPKVSSRVNVVAGFGDVADGYVETVNLTVMRAAGASDIDLSKATIQWIGPESATTLTAADTTTADTFAVEPVTDADDSAPVLNEHADRVTLVMDATDVGSALAPGAEVQLTITTQYGAKTIYWVTVPEDLSGESTVML